MIISFYYPKADEQEVEYWIRFLEQERGITEFPDIPSHESRLLAYHNGKEVYFVRDGRSLGHFIIEKYDAKTRTTEIRSLPHFTYQPGNLADRIIDKPHITA